MKTSQQVKSFDSPFELAMWRRPVGVFIPIAVFCYLFPPVISLTRHSWAWLPPILYTLIIVFSILASVAFLASLMIADKPSRTRVLMHYHLTVAFSLACLIIAGFSQLCRHLGMIFGGFSATDWTFWHWLRWGYGWALDDMTFSGSTIFGWDTTEIHATALWSRVLVLLFNMVLASFVVLGALRFLSVLQFNRASVELSKLRPAAIGRKSASSWLGIDWALIAWQLLTATYFGFVATEGFREDLVSGPSSVLYLDNYISAAYIIIAVHVIWRSLIILRLGYGASSQRLRVRAYFYAGGLLTGVVLCGLALVLLHFLGVLPSLWGL